MAQKRLALHPAEGDHCGGLLGPVAGVDLFLVFRPGKGSLDLAAATITPLRGPNPHILHPHCPSILPSPTFLHSVLSPSTSYMLLWGYKHGKALAFLPGLWQHTPPRDAAVPLLTALWHAALAECSIISRTAQKAPTACIGIRQGTAGFQVSNIPYILVYKSKHLCFKINPVNMG